MVLAVSLIFTGALGGWLLFGSVLDDTTGESAVAVTEPEFLEKTGAIPVVLDVMPNRRSIFEDGIDAIKADDLPAAIAARNSLKRGDIGRDALTYLISHSRSHSIPSSEYEGARRELEGWPGVDDFRISYERALYRENPSAAQIMAAFRTIQPVTPEGNILLARALRDSGEDDDAKQLILRLWSGEALTVWLESEILKHFGDMLSTADHRIRMEYLLYRDRIRQATRFADLASAHPHFDAWSAVIRGNRNAGKLLDAAEKSYKDTPALTFTRIQYLRKQDKYDDAAKLLATIKPELEKAVMPGEWWAERRIVSRGLYEEGQKQRAYDIASAHQSAQPEDIADAEFHAGWYALRGLKDAKLARPHFEKLLAISTLPATRARANYWLGRALEATDEQLADKHLSDAAALGATYYGQLAAARIKKPIDIADQKTEMTSISVAQQPSRALEAIDYLEKAGHHDLTRPLYLAIAENGKTDNQMTALVSRAEDIHDSALALAVGKIAYYRGLAHYSSAFPISAIPDNAGLSPEERALSLAIARQESGFNGSAVSPVNARGLMQVMPGTAKEISAKLGLAYAPEKLTADDAYNALLGSHYAGEQIRRHNGSYILTFAAYNAGPGRVKEWLKRFGDPRGKKTDEIIDWVEMIPFPETRAYVQHVLENFQVYKSQLGLPSDIEADLAAGG